LVLDDDLSFRCSGEERPRIDDFDRLREWLKPAAPTPIRTAEEECRLEWAADKREPFEAILKHTFVQEQLGSVAKGAVAPKRPQFTVENVRRPVGRHKGACAAHAASRQAAIW